MSEQVLSARSSSNAAEYSVSELSSAIKRTLEDGFGYVRLRGEISGFRGPHSSGHCYFALKDDRAKIEAVVWRGVYSKLKIKPEEGMEVLAQGRITTYANSSKYQIVIESLEPAGVGALMALLEERKKKLAAEGLFNEERKRPIPFLPRVVGIVTSPTGAVIRDMLHGFQERFPTRVIVWPARVQGEGSANEIATAIRGFNALRADAAIPRPDVLIVARGGGSLEDLWSFNEEIVVRAAAESEIPLISAVGHETDWTLIDLVADARAPTPTKAAEWAVPIFADLAAQNEDLARRLKTGARRSLDTARTNLRAAARGLPRPADLIAMPRQRYDAVERRLARGLLANTRAHATGLARIAGRLQPALLHSRVRTARASLQLFTQRSTTGYRQLCQANATRLVRVGGRLRPDMMRIRMQRADERFSIAAERVGRAFRQRVTDLRGRLDAHGKLLMSLGYQSVLQRGFAVVRDDRGQMVRSKQHVTPGMALEIEVSDGKFAADVPSSPSDGRAPPTERPRPVKPGTVRSAVRTGSKSGGGQGSLF